MKHHITLLLTLLMGILVVAACQSETPPPPPPPPPPTEAAAPTEEAAEPTVDVATTATAEAAAIEATAQVAAAQVTAAAAAQATAEAAISAATVAAASQAADEAVARATNEAALAQVTAAAAAQATAEAVLAQATAEAELSAAATITAATAATTSEAASTTPEAAPTVEVSEAPTGRIYFSVFSSTLKSYNIYAANLDGSDRELIVTEASQPDISPNGEYIVFRSWKNDNRGIVENKLAGGQNWRVTITSEAGRPQYAPDGQSFLLHSNEGADDKAYAIYHVAGEKYEVLRRDTKPIQGEAPDWTPDGKSFVYKGCIATNCGIFFSNLDGSDPKQLSKNLNDTNPEVSPDGKTVLFMSETAANNWDVYSVGIDGSNLKQMTTYAGNDGLPVWSPDGKTIAFVSQRDETWAIWAVDANGGNERKLFDLGGSINERVYVEPNARGWIEETLVWTE